jgi:hypothetical protein
MEACRRVEFSCKRHTLTSARRLGNAALNAALKAALKVSLKAALPTQIRAAGPF